MIPKIQIVNVSTGEIEVRDMNEQELAQYKIDNQASLTTSNT